MAKKTFRLNVTVGVPDPALSTKEVRDPATGTILVPAATGLKHVPPGDPVELEEEEGNRLLALYGAYKRPVPADQEPKVLRG